MNGPGEKRPDLECVDPLDPTLRVLIDIQITSPCSTSLFQVASSKPLHAAEQAEKAKHRKYDRHLRPGYKLVPFVLEVYGAWGKEAIRFASSLATKAPSVDKIGTNIHSPSSTGSLVRVSGFPLIVETYFSFSAISWLLSRGGTTRYCSSILSASAGPTKCRFGAYANRLCLDYCVVWTLVD